MAREHARILCSIWRDIDFRGLTTDEQWLFEALLSQPTINNAGVIAYTPRSWSKLAADMTEARVEAALSSLATKRYVVLDEDTDELLVRSFVKSDGVAKNGRVFQNSLKVARQVQSDKLRHVLAAELRKLGTENARQCADELDPRGPGTGNSGTAITKKENGTGSETERPKKSGGTGTGTGVKSPSVVGSVSSNRARSDTAPNTRMTTKATDKAFDEFWAAYPRREAKQGAKGKFRQAVKAGTPADTIIVGAKRYAAYIAQVGREREKTKIPTTWLNQGCWDDELASPDGRGATNAPKPTGDPADWLRERWQAGDAVAVAKILGARYEQPDLPLTVEGKEAAATFFRTTARGWIEDHRDAAIAKLTGVAA